MTGMKEKRFTKKEWSWILYDWANSIYATNIMAAIYPTIFASVVADGDIWWGYGTSIATLIVAILAPVLGALADYQGMKKKLFSAFVGIGAGFTLLMAFTGNWKLMLIGYVISRIGFSGSCLFYDSFLTDVTTDERMDRVSSWGYAMGYIGGSTIPFLISIAVLLLNDYSDFAVRFSVIIVSVWWIVFSVPFMKNVKQEHYIQKTGRLSLAEVFGNIRKTAVDIFRYKGLFIFVLAYFFYIDGVNTVISISTAYGSALGLGATGMILALLVTQIVAMPCSILFARISEKFNARKALTGAVVVYLLICLVGFYMGFSMEPSQAKYEELMRDSATPFRAEIQAEDVNDFDAYVADVSRALRSEDPEAELQKITPAENLINIKLTLDPTLRAAAQAQPQIVDDFNAAISFSTVLFWCMAFLVGTVQGGIQAVSRSYFGKIVPKERSNEFFGFFDIFGKFACVIGPALYAFIAGITGRSSLGVLSLIVLFGIGLLVLILGREEMDKLEKSK